MFERSRVRVGIGILAALGYLPEARAATAAAPAEAPGGLTAWALSSWERALRSDGAGSRRSIELYAARGEWESFQIAVRAERSVRIADLELGAFAAEGGARFPEGAGRRYRAHQLHLVRPTARNETFRPDWYPDALIPFPEEIEAFRAREGSRGRAAGPEAAAPRYRAVPFDLPPGETHTFWIDVRVPRDAAAGAYRASAAVVCEGGGRAEIPVAVHVWPFELPESASLRTAFGSPAPRVLDGYRDEVAKKRLERVPDAPVLYRACAELTTDHRMNSYPPPELVRFRPGPDGGFEVSAEVAAAWREFLARYHVNAVAVDPPSRWFRDPVADREKILRYARSWDRFLEAIGRPDLLLYTYLIDEPNDREAYEHVRAWGRAIREAGSRLKVLVTEQTKTQDPAWGDLYGSVDIWVPLFSLFDPETAAARQALGEEIWTYTALCQGRPTPWWHIDYPLLNYRIPAWIAWSYRMKGLLYWGGMSYWKNVEDPWTDPETYTPGRDLAKGKLGAIYNGEGSLLYPGTAVGLADPVPSMRLKALRDGLEDFDYLAILDRLGRRAQAEGLVRSVASSWYEWSRDPERWAQVRRKLGCLIADALASPGAAPPKSR
ncbi:MAG: DUF4091 domain-containing protein [Planctomycetota bacterium]